ncbi:hypothetical protein Vafri_5769 [Volvox africanus]|nr:hypothetical protein Vafri_5769 [Volvox africanus]
MSKNLTRRRVTIDNRAKTPRKPEAGEENEQIGMQSIGTTIKWSLPVEAYGFGYLLTGTTLAVLGQLVTNQGATDPATQLIAWTKYFCTFVLSLAIQLVSSRSVLSNGNTSAAPTPVSWTATSATTSAVSASTATLTKPASGGVCSDDDSRKAVWLTAAVGLLDTLSYSLNCLGFALCGSALSMVVFAASGQVFTAVTRRVLLHKTMTAGQISGVGLVVVGLIVRSAGKIREALTAATAATTGFHAASGDATSATSTLTAAMAATTGFHAASGDATSATSTLTAATAVARMVSDRDITLGVVLIVLSAFGYSLLGCLYEWLSAVRGLAMSHAQVATGTSLIGLVATSIYQLLYTRPRWQELVADRMAQRGLRWWPVVRLYGVFGALFTLHGLVQGVVLQRSGATAVGIISAMRASAVALASGVLFCGPQAPQQCLTPASAASAGIVTGGALLWTLTGTRKSSPPPPPSSAPPSTLLASTAAAAAPGAAECKGCDRPPEDALHHKYGKLH